MDVGIFLSFYESNCVVFFAFYWGLLWDDDEGKKDLWTGIVNIKDSDCSFYRIYIVRLHIRK